MPTYTYQCQNKNCGHMVDAFKSIAKRDETPPFCEKCGGQRIERMLAGPPGKVIGGHDSEYSKTGPYSGRRR